MKISGIDKDFEDIIYSLDKNGFKPFASCDGVEANHENPNDVSDAYIVFMKSPRIIELFSKFLENKETFNILLENEGHLKPYELYGNIISGTTYNVKFSNKKGENTRYFKDIIRNLINNREKTLTDNQKKLHSLEKVLEEDTSSKLFFQVSLNGNYQPYMQKKEIINELIIGTKLDDENINQTMLNMYVLADILAEKYNIKQETYSSNKYPEKEFIISSSGKESCSIYFTDEHFNQILELIRYIRNIEHTIPTFEVREWLGSDEEMYGEMYDENGDEMYDEMALKIREEKLSQLEKEARELALEERQNLNQIEEDR